MVEPDMTQQRSQTGCKDDLPIDFPSFYLSIYAEMWSVTTQSQQGYMQDQLMYV